jgi:dynein heavy chain
MTAKHRVMPTQVKEAAIELGYQPDETFCLKISQLRELFVVRWSVFLLGPAGCGKSAIWRTLMKAQNNAGEKTVSIAGPCVRCMYRPAFAYARKAVHRTAHL